MTRYGALITRHAIRRPIDTGIEYGKPLADGWVAEFEVREAAVYCNYTPAQFAEMDWWERARCVAQYRLHRLVELHAQDAQGAAIDRESRKKR